jgi:RHS repeat-associated protein
MDAGTAQILTDSNQATVASYQFSAWGELFSSSGSASTPLSWAGWWGYYRDTSMRSWVRSRHLDVLRARWFSQDPIGFFGWPNLYRYVSNSPMRWVDPTGLVDVPINFEEDPIPESGLQDIGRRYRAFRCDPSFRPGSKERTRYSEFLSGLAWPLSVYSALTGCDPIAGRRVSDAGRLLSLASLVPIFGRLRQSQLRAFTANQRKQRMGVLLTARALRRRGLQVVGREVHLRVQIGNRVETVIPDLAAREPWEGGRWFFAEGKYGPSAGRTWGQRHGYPLIPRQGIIAAYGPEAIRAGLPTNRPITPQEILGVGVYYWGDEPGKLWGFGRLKRVKFFF